VLNLLKNKTYSIFEGLFILIILVSISAADGNYSTDNNFEIDKNVKIESNLLNIKPTAFIAMQSQTENPVKVVIELDAQDNSYLRSLEDKGAVIETVYENLVQAAVPSSSLPAIADMPYVNYVRSPFRPYKDAFTSEGVGVIKVDELHNLGYRGDGVKIAIIDAGFSGYESKRDTELPESVTTRSFRADGDITGNGEVHGTAVAEIIYDIAPNATFYLLNFDGDVEFGNAVDYAISQDVDIISMSMVFLSGPYNGTGKIDAIVDKATSKGIIWVNSAGNYAQHHWEGNYTEKTILINSETWNVHDFGNGDETNSFYANEGDVIEGILSWNEWPRSSQDYELFLANEDLRLIVYLSGNPQNGTQEPSEIINYIVPTPGHYGFIIAKYDANKAVRFELYSPNHDLEYKNESSSLGLPADKNEVIAVGATKWSDDSLETFSSQGPTNDGRIKPDIVAPDGVSTSTYGSNGFLGTSASAPHVAGAAALLLQQNSSISADQLKQALESGAKDLGKPGKDNLFGAGRIDIFTSYLQIVPPLINFTLPTPLNGTFTSKNWVLVNITSDEPIETAELEWNSIKESMSASGIAWYRNKTSLSDGIYNFRVRGKNSGGKWNSTEMRTVTIDTHSPIVTIDSPENNSFMNNPNIFVNGTATDVFGIKTGCINNWCTPVNNLTNLVFNYTVRLNEGSNRIDVTYTDIAENNGSASVYAILNTVHPVINNVSLNDTMMKSGDKFFIEVNATDSITENLKVVMHLINESKIEVYNSSLNKIAPGIYKFESTVDAKIPEGILTLNITASDELLNTVYNDSLNVIIDKTKPKVTDIKLSKFTPEINDAVNITVNVSDKYLNTSGIFATLKSPNGFIHKSSMINLGDGNYSLNFTNTSEYGRYDVTILASDKAGNINDSVKTWFITTKASSIHKILNAGEVNTIDLLSLSLDISVNDSIFTDISIMEMASFTPDISSDLLGFKFMNKLIDIDITNETRDHLERVKFRFYYTQSELDAAGLKETNLKILLYNETSAEWENIPQQGVNTKNIEAYAGYVWANISHLSTFAIVGSVTKTIGDGGGNGGGGGGGGGMSGENSSNIEVIEKYDLQISKNVTTSYRFTHPKNPIMFVNITGNTSLGIITTSVEVLKNTSTLVKFPPAGLVYRNANIWVGTTGFATPKNIKEAIISFRIESSWLRNNNIAAGGINLLRWDGNEWIRLGTSEKDKDSIYTYFEAKTNAFSPFSISGLKEVTSAAASVVTTAAPTPITTPGIPVEEITPSTNWAVIIGVMLVIGIVVVLYLRWKGKSG
jgi:PGF-pre-PGF domain-containing protein